MQYGTVLNWGLFMYSGFVHEGGHINAVRYCFNLRSLDVGCACVMFVRRDDEKETQKNTKTNTFQVQSAKCAHP